MEYEDDLQLTADNVLDNSYNDMMLQQLQQNAADVGNADAVRGLRELYYSDESTTPRSSVYNPIDPSSYSYSYSFNSPQPAENSALKAEEERYNALSQEVNDFSKAVSSYEPTGTGYTSNKGGGFGKSAYGYGGVKTGQKSQKGSAPYGLQPQMWSALQAAFSDMKAAGVGTPRITDGFRSYQLQVTTRQKKGKLASLPGNSVHGLGWASDLALNRKQQKWLEKNGIKYGLARLPSESWHWQLMPQFVKGAPKPNKAAAKTAKRATTAVKGTATNVQGTKKDIRYSRVI